MKIIHTYIFRYFWSENKTKKCAESSTQSTFIVKRSPRKCSLQITNDIFIPVWSEITYLDTLLEKHLTRSPCLKVNRKSTGIGLHLFLNFKILLYNTFLICRTIVRHVCSYEIAIWGPVKPFNTRPIRSFQSIAPRLWMQPACVRIKCYLTPWLKNNYRTSHITHKRFCQNSFISCMSIITLLKDQGRGLKRKRCIDSI